jgi:hypothetical protein
LPRRLGACKTKAPRACPLAPVPWWISRPVLQCWPGDTRKQFSDDAPDSNPRSSPGLASRTPPQGPQRQLPAAIFDWLVRGGQCESETRNIKKPWTNRGFCISFDTSCTPKHLSAGVGGCRAVSVANVPMSTEKPFSLQGTADLSCGLFAALLHCFIVIWAARALPPFRPPRRPSPLPAWLNTLGWLRGHTRNPDRQSAGRQPPSRGSRRTR